MELEQFFVYIDRLLKNVLTFCDNYAGVATILGFIVAFLGFLGIKELIQKRKEKKKYHDMFVAPAKKKSPSAKLDAYIDSTYNGASDLEVIDDE